MEFQIIRKLKTSKTLRDIRWALISLAISSLVHFLLRIVLGRYLGAYGLGLYTLVFVIYLFGMQFAAFGIGAALTKYVAEHNKSLKKVMSFVTSGIIGSFLTGIVIGIIIYLASDMIAIKFFHSYEMIGLLKITAFCFPFIAIQKAVIGTLNGLRKMKVFALVNILQNLSAFIISLILVIILKLGVEGGVIGFVFPTIAISLISLFFIKNYINVKFSLFNNFSKQLLFFGAYIVLINSIALINTQIDSILIGRFMTETDVGYYSISIILIQALLLLPQSIQRVTTPMISTYYGKKELNNIQKLIKQAMFRTFIITLMFSFLLFIFGRFIIEFLFTNEFLPAYNPLLILLIGYTIYSSIVSVGAAFSSMGKISLSFRIAALTAFINIILNIIMIPRYGIIGAASATTISLITSTSIYIVFFKKYIFTNFINQNIKSK